MTGGAAGIRTDEEDMFLLGALTSFVPPLVFYIAYQISESGQSIFGTIFLMVGGPIVIIFTLLFIRTLFVFHDYRKGLLAVFGFIFSMEAMRILADPYIGNHLNSWSCSVLEIPISECFKG